MRRNTYFAFAMMAMMAMANTTYAQRFEGRGGHREGGREMVTNHNGGFQMRGHRNEGRGMNEYRDRHDMGRNHGGRELNMNHGGRPELRGNFRNHDRHHEVGHFGHNIHRPVIADHHFRGTFDHRGHVHGWEGRVRHLNGRWGYFRNNRWYWYNRYFEPTYYFATPVHHFNDYYFVEDGCYVPGWEGRVCYRNGRWGYLRGRDWYWYDTYFEPDYYFARPVAHFHSHVCTADRVVGAVAGGLVLGTIIAALCN